MQDNERRFEQDIESWLISGEGGWTKKTFGQTRYNPELGLDLEALISYIKTTQPKQWERYEKIIDGI